jgi:hypothetical protein
VVYSWLSFSYSSSENNSFDNTSGVAQNIPHALVKRHAQAYLKEVAMSHPAIPVSKETCPRPCAAQTKDPIMPKFSAELMKMLAQLVMLR